MVGTPESQLVDLMSARVHKAVRLAPSSSRAPSPSVEGQQAPSPLGRALKRAHHAPTTKSVALKEEKVTSQEVPLPLRPLLAPWEALSFWWH